MLKFKSNIKYLFNWCYISDFIWNNCNAQSPLRPAVRFGTQNLKFKIINDYQLVKAPDM